MQKIVREEYLETGPAVKLCMNSGKRRVAAQIKYDQLLMNGQHRGKRQKEHYNNCSWPMKRSVNMQWIVATLFLHSFGSRELLVHLLPPIKHQRSHIHQAHRLHPPQSFQQSFLLPSSDRIEQISTPSSTTKIDRRNAAAVIICWYRHYQNKTCNWLLLPPPLVMKL